MSLKLKIGVQKYLFTRFHPNYGCPSLLYPLTQGHDSTYSLPFRTATREWYSPRRCIGCFQLCTPLSYTPSKATVSVKVFTKTFYHTNFTSSSVYFLNKMGTVPLFVQFMHFGDCPQNVQFYKDCSVPREIPVNLAKVIFGILCSSIKLFNFSSLPSSIASASIDTNRSSFQISSQSSSLSSGIVCPVLITYPIAPHLH